MNILSAISKTGFTSFFVLLCGAITSKLLSVYFGPSGIVEFSQFRQIAQWVIILGTVNGSTALIKRTAGLKNKKSQSFFSSIVALYVAGAFVSSLSLYFLYSEAPFAFLNEVLTLSSSPIYHYILAIFVGIASSLFLSILSGQKKISLLCISQIVGSLSGVITTIIIVLLGFKEFTGLIFIMNLLGSMTTAAFACIYFKLVPSIKISSIRNNDLKSHITFSSAFLLTGLIGSTVPILIRSIYIENYGIISGANFDAAWTISIMYVAVILASLNSFYLPSITGANKNQFNRMLNEVFKPISLIAFVLVSSIIVFKYQVVTLLYTDEFIGAVDILNWTTAGDFLKIMSFVFGMFLISEEHTRVYILSDVTFQIILISIVIIFISSYQPIIGVAYFVSNLIYFIFILIYSNKVFHIALNKSNLRITLTIILLLILALYLSSLEVMLSLRFVFIGILVCGLFYFGFRQKDRKILIGQLSSLIKKSESYDKD